MRYRDLYRRISSGWSRRGASSGILMNGTIESIGTLFLMRSEWLKMAKMGQLKGIREVERCYDDCLVAKAKRLR
jgi:hypothetical protein